MATAQAQYNELASRPTASERLEAQRRFDLARLALEQAQRAYDDVRGDPHIAMLPQALALQQTTTEYEAARNAFQIVAQGATPRAARRRDQPDQRAEGAGTGDPRPCARGRGGREVGGGPSGRAQAGLDRVKAGMTAEDKAVADARIRSALAGLAQAQAQLRQTQIVAPFAGQIGTIYLRPGEPRRLGNRR